MRARWSILSVVVAMGAGYGGSPYAALYRLDHAIRHADAAALETIVDWYAVREGLKEDLCDLVLDEPASARPANELPPFGEGFVRGVTGNMLDRSLTAENVAILTREGAETGHADTHVRWAFFSDPTRFSVDLLAEGTAEPIRLELHFRNLRWQVRRVWLPNELLEKAGAGI